MEKLQPKLRFPEFKEKLITYQLGDITEWASGGTPSKQIESYWSGNIPWISASSMRGIVYMNSELKITTEALKKGSRLAEKGSLLILVRGSMLFNKIPVGIAGIDVAFNQDLKSIKVTDKSNSEFILQWFFSIESSLMSMVTGTGIGAGKLDLADLKSLKIKLPSLPEQTKIASFLSSVDEKLNLLKEKKAALEEYKKGMMQKIFSQEIRFKPSPIEALEIGSDEFPEWEEKTLGECLDYEQPTNYLVASTEYDNTYPTPVLTAGKTFILGYTNETFGIFNNFPVIIFDDFTTATQFVNFPFKAKSSAMKILKAKGQNNVKFLYEAMQMINYETGGHGRHWISIFSQMEIFMPCIEEQTKIATFLSVIDEKISLVSTQIEETQAYKKGLLQGMFC